MGYLEVALATAGAIGIGVHITWTGNRKDGGQIRIIRFVITLK